MNQCAGVRVGWLTRAHQHDQRDIVLHLCQRVDPDQLRLPQIPHRTTRRARGAPRKDNSFPLGSTGSVR